MSPPSTNAQPRGGCSSGTRSAQWEHASAAELVGEHRAHLYPLERIVAALEPHFQVGTPLYGPYLYRWDLDEKLRRPEEEAIARAEIPAVGARLLAKRHT